MSFASKRFNTVTGFGIGAALMTSGCGVRITPEIKHFTKIDPTNCNVEKADIFKRGLILSILLPFLPDHSKSDRTGRDPNCFDRLVAENLLMKNDPQSRIIAVAIYDQLTPDEKKRIDTLVAANGTTMDELAADMPRISQTTTDGNCAVIFYKLPGQDQAMVATVSRCSGQPMASQPSRAPS